MENENLNLGNDLERISFLKTVAEAASSQAKVTNRFWLSVIVTTTIIFLPITQKGVNGESLVRLPFSLGAVPLESFYPAVFVILSVLAIGLAAAHAQQMRADWIAHYTVDELIKASNSTKNTESISFHIKDLFDILRHPSLTRLAPLPQLVMGHFHTHNLRKTYSPKTKWLRDFIFKFSYYSLKLFAIIVLFIIPIFSLAITYNKISQSLNGVLLYLLMITGLTAFIALIAVTIAEIVAVIRVSKKVCQEL